MISWIQTTFQHHFRTVFLVLLAVIIVSFVFVIGASPGIGHGERGSLKKEFFGMNLASQADVQRMQGDAALSIELQYGFPVSGDRIAQFAYARQASLHLADQLHVPRPTDAEIVEGLKKMRMFANDQGQFDNAKYEEVRRNLQKNKGAIAITEADMLRVVSDNLRVERVQKLLAGPGFVMPADVNREIAVADTSWTLAIAKLNRASYAPTLSPSEADLQKFYEENKFRYTIPKRVLVSAADFPLTSYVSKIKSTEEEVRAYFDTNPMRFAAQPAEGKQPVAPEYSQVRDVVAQTFFKERAARLAADDAVKLSLQLFDNKLAPGNPRFDLTLSQFNVAARDLPPFTEDQTLPEFASNPQITAEAFKLDADHPISDALLTAQGAVVLFYRGSIEPTPQTFVEARAQVLADYTETERTRRFIAAGALIRGAALAKTKAGVPFETAVTQAAADQKIQVEVNKPAPFTLRQPPQDLDRSAFQTLLTLQKGNVSEMVSTSDYGLLVYAAEQKVPALGDANPTYDETKRRISATVAQNNGAEYLEEMITQELNRAEQATR